ncbi:MAG: 2-oxoacid:acceptor oxidoreductase subunit alpha [Planctomycetes bacterium]|nr:2-oxoacid:acceptor oxidoreductase subunit alpha [Planctomycetota bacterium]
MTEHVKHAPGVEEVESVVIRFAGDSGDGMQLAGTQFTTSNAAFGSDFATFPDYPAEIRAPAGSLPGVSGFQIHFSSRDIHTPGDAPQVLIAMNPAALKVNLSDLEHGGMIIANKDAFTKDNLTKAGFSSNPLEDGSLSGYTLHSIPISTLNLESLKESPLNKKEADRSKNLFALGLVCWLYDRPLEPIVDWIQSKFKKNPDTANANTTALKAGWSLGYNTEIFPSTYRVKKASLPPGVYRRVTGNEAIAIGLVAAAKLANKELLYGTYPITPASDILHELSKFKKYGVKTFQCEDEIAGICAAIGASFAGDLGVTGTSGPGVALKGEAIGLAVMTELPLLIINVQRGGPSTGLPTKTEQADLLQAVYGRNGECPVAVIGASSPADCFEVTVEAVRIALQHMTPVILLSDGYIANGAEPWRLPTVDSLKPIHVDYVKAFDPEFQPYARNSDSLARVWAIPGTPGLEHRIGGLEKKHITGGVNYDGDNHQFMVNLRQEKVDRIANFIPEQDYFGELGDDLAIVGWGGTRGAITTAVEKLRKEGRKVTQVHVRYLNPFPRNLKSVLQSFKKVLVPELNLGQLSMLIQTKCDIKPIKLSKVKGQPFMVREITKKALAILSGEDNGEPVPFNLNGNDSGNSNGTEA